MTSRTTAASHDDAVVVRASILAGANARTLSPGLRPASGCVKLPRDNLSHNRFCNDDLPHPPVFHRTRATYDSATFVDRMRIGHTQRIQ